MKTLVVGLGSIGSRHIKNIKDIDANMRISIWRQNSKETELGELESSVDNVFLCQEDAQKWEPDVTFVTNPATMHRETALIFAKQDSHLFIEKPLSVDSDGLDELAVECKSRNLVAMIGYVLRFSPPIKLIKDIIEQGRIGRVLSIRTSVGQNLLNWRSGKRYQDTVSARKDLGGGVLLELSHELDYVRWFAGEVKEVSALTGKVSNLEVDVEDIADICLRFESGALGNIHLDMVDHAANRSCRVVGTKGTVIWHSDDDNSVSLYSEETGGWTEMYKTSVTDGNEKFRAELRHFFECIADSKMPLISIEDGRRVVEIVSAAKRSAETGETISL